MTPDRTVHGLYDGGEIVRYNRAGKWYLEGPLKRRMPLLVKDAAQLAASGTWYLGRSGGQAFDAKVRRLRDQQGLAT
jgi:hypothetical protein